jgi:hypothetical protein
MNDLVAQNLKLFNALLSYCLVLQYSIALQEFSPKLEKKFYSTNF